MYFKRRIKTKPDKLTRLLFLYMLIICSEEFSVPGVLDYFEISFMTLKRDIQILEEIGLIEGYTFDKFDFYCDFTSDGEVNSNALPDPNDVKLRRFGRILRLFSKISDSIWYYFADNVSRNFHGLDMVFNKYEDCDDEDFEVLPKKYSDIQAADFFDLNTSPSKKREIQRDLKVLKTAVDLLCRYFVPMCKKSD